MSAVLRSVRWWVLLLAALASGVLTASLGRWQLSRAAEKEALAAAITARQQQAPLTGRSLAGPMSVERAAELLHRPVELHGRWLPERTVYLDNRPMQGQTGFYVATPLRLAEPGADTVVLVLRGWVPRNFMQRDALPSMQTPTGEVVVSGRIAERLPRLYALGQEERGTIRQNLDLDAYRAETGLPLAGVTVWQTDASADGLRRDWPAPDSGVDKHRGYALQWFGLCALIAILFLWFQVVRPLQRSTRT